MRSATIASSLKNTNEGKKIVNWIVSVLSAAFSSASFVSTLSVVGLLASVPLGGVGGCFALVSSGLIIASKKLDSKIKKHQKITALAVAKRDTIDRLFSKALNNNEVSSHEFDTILSEFQQYNSLKEQVRAKMLRQPKRNLVISTKLKM